MPTPFHCDANELELHRSDNFGEAPSTEPYDVDTSGCPFDVPGNGMLPGKEVSRCQCGYDTSVDIVSDELYMACLREGEVHIRGACNRITGKREPESRCDESEVVLYGYGDDSTEVVAGAATGGIVVVLRMLLSAYRV